MPIKFPTYTKEFHHDTYPAISPTSAAIRSDIKGKTVLVTGGGSGIGAAITRSFAAAGAAVVTITGRNVAALQTTKKDVEKEFPETEIKVFKADNEKPEELAAAFDGTGTVDVLVHNAAFMSDLTPITKADPDDWWKGFEINVRGSFNVMREFAKHVKPSDVPEKQPVLLASTTAAAHAGSFPDYSSYQTTKLAQVKVFDVFQAENPGIRVTHVHPGVIKGSSMGSKSSVHNPDLFEPDEIALPADFNVWAATPTASFLKGKLVWSNWDAEELVQRKDEIAGGNALTLGLNGWP